MGLPHRGAQTSKLVTRTKAGRLRHRSEFLRVYDQGSKAHGRYMTLFVLPNRLDCTRLGIAATRKMGMAVERNRAKRRVREVFRLGSWPMGLDLVVVVRRELVKAAWSDIVQEFGSLLKRQRKAHSPRGLT